MIEKYEIRNEKFNDALEGYLYFDTDTEEFSMTLLDDYTNKKPDIFFKLLHDQGIKEVPPHLVKTWVDGRVFPPNRQGLRGMLEEMGMKEYNVHDILVYGNGKCQMDFSYIKRVEN